MIFWQMKKQTPKTKSSKPNPPLTITLPPRDYQPSKAEKEKAVDMPAASLKTIKEAFFQPVQVKIVKKPVKRMC